MLKGAVVGGQSIVFTRYHEVGVMKLRSHQIAAPRPCKHILGYDANALYLSTMLREMSHTAGVPWCGASRHTATTRQCLIFNKILDRPHASLDVQGEWHNWRILCSYN